MTWVYGTEIHESYSLVVSARRGGTPEPALSEIEGSCGFPDVGAIGLAPSTKARPAALPIKIAFAATYPPTHTSKVVMAGPAHDAPLPVSTSVRPEFPDKQTALFHDVMLVLDRCQVPYVVAGAFALQKHTGIWRCTKDMDLFLSPEAVPCAIRCLEEDGFACEVRDPVWLFKVHRDDYFVDLITGMSNGTFTVDASWISNSQPGEVLGIPAKVLAAEELLASKLFILRRERFDGADIVHIIYATHGHLNWDRIFQLVGEHWGLLLGSLVLFRYVYPAHSSFVPHSVWQHLVSHFWSAIVNPDPAAPFRGSLIDEKMFAIDTAEWGMEDVLCKLRSERRARVPVPDRAV